MSLNVCLSVFSSVSIVLLQCSSASWLIFFFSENFHQLLCVDSYFRFSYTSFV